MRERGDDLLKFDFETFEFEKKEIKFSFPLLFSVHLLHLLSAPTGFSLRETSLSLSKTSLSLLFLVYPRLSFHYIALHMALVSFSVLRQCWEYHKAQ